MDDPNADPLTRSAAADRLYYALGTLLNADDLADEQAYHRGQLARALRYLHGTGTVAGLRVAFAPTGHPDEIVVEPGMAIDRVGRIVVVPRLACIRLPQWYDGQKTAPLVTAFSAGSVVVDVFLRYAACERGKTPAFASGTLEALDAAVPARVRDWYALDLVPARDPAVGPPLPDDKWKTLTPDPPVPPQPPVDPLTVVFGAWHDEAAEIRERGVPAVWSDDEEYLGGAENERPRSTAVFLARVRIPAAAGARPTRTAGGAVTVDNTPRLVVFPTAVIARFARVR